MKQIKIYFSVNLVFKMVKNVIVVYYEKNMDGKGIIDLYIVYIIL